MFLGDIFPIYGVIDGVVIYVQNILLKYILIVYNGCVLQLYSRFMIKHDFNDFFNIRVRFVIIKIISKMIISITQIMCVKLFEIFKPTFGRIFLLGVLPVRKS